VLLLWSLLLLPSACDHWFLFLQHVMIASGFSACDHCF